MAWAFLFPGQGSAAVGMGAEMFAVDRRTDRYFAQASDLLGRDLKRITLEGPEETLVATENAQPAIFALSAACFDAFLEKLIGAVPALPGTAEGPKLFLAGHSLGEYTALYAAGVISREAATALVTKRGQFMAEACAADPGTMGAVLGLEDAKVEEICREASAAGVVVPANYNVAGQVVVSGTAAGVARAGELATARGGKFSPLKVSGAFHSPLVAEAGERMKGELARVAFAPPGRGVFIPNVTGEPAADAAAISDFLYRQIASPVLWRKTLEGMVDAGVTAAVEFGHGRVLAGMVKKVKKDIRVFNVSDPASSDAAVAGLTREGV